MHSGEFVDTMADYLAIFVLFFVPALLIYLFWMVHILPEKIAERRGHPQADAIKTLCLLSLFFGGMLWPLAWLWAYSKPVLYKMAYGVDTVKPEEHDVPPAESPPATAQDSAEELHPAEDALGATLPARNARALAHERRPWER